MCILQPGQGWGLPWEQHLGAAGAASCWAILARVKKKKKGNNNKKKKCWRYKAWQVCPGSALLRHPIDCKVKMFISVHKIKVQAPVFPNYSF